MVNCDSCGAPNPDNQMLCYNCKEALVLPSPSSQPDDDLPDPVPQSQSTPVPPSKRAGRRYGTVRIVALIFKVLSALMLLLGLFCLVGMLYFAIGTVILSIFTFTAGEVICLLIDIAEDTRAIRDRQI